MDDIQGYEPFMASAGPEEVMDLHAECRAKLAQIRSDHERMVAVHTDAYAEMQRTVESRDRMIAELGYSNAQLVEQRDLLAAALADRDEKIAALHASLNHERAIFDDGIKRLRAELASMTAQRDSARDAHDAALRRIEELEEQNDGLNNDLIMMRAKRPALYAIAEAARAWGKIYADTAPGYLDGAEQALLTALAAETSTGVGTSGAGSNEGRRSVASDESHLTSTDALREELEAQRDSVLELCWYEDGEEREDVRVEEILEVLLGRWTEEQLDQARARARECAERLRPLMEAASGAGQADGEQVVT